MDDGAPFQTAPTQCVLFAGRFLDQSPDSSPGHAGALSPVGGRPFLTYLLWHALRFGFLRALILVEDEAAAVAVRNAEPQGGWGLEVSIVVIPPTAGTAGALRAVVDQLDPRFLLLEATTLFDFNWLDLFSAAPQNPAAKIWMSTRIVVDPDRGRPGHDSPTSGVWLVDREVVLDCPTRGSFESDVIPSITARGQTVGVLQDGFFLDITAPGALEAAQRLVPASLARPAVFFDRDGVLNVDHGYTHRWADFEWVEGAIEAIKDANDRNLFVFVTTNQSGVARGFYEEAAIDVLHRQMQNVLRAHGAHVDDIRYCPHHPDGVVSRYARACDWRKPGAGMLLDLARHWPVDLGASLMIGDNLTDLEAASAAGVRGVLFDKGRLDDSLRTQLGPRVERP
jgi:D-glycero-D-manno-heptose 1,7-bisphosphate phosphatase